MTTSKMSILAFCFFLPQALACDSTAGMSGSTAGDTSESTTETVTTSTHESTTVAATVGTHDDTVESTTGGNGNTKFDLEGSETAYHNPSDPDTSGWEDLTVQGIYSISGGDIEGASYSLVPCAPEPGGEWCVYWDTDPLAWKGPAPAGCRSKITFRGKRSEPLGETELCNSPLGHRGHFERAFLVEEILSNGPCEKDCRPDLEMCGNADDWQTCEPK